MKALLALLALLALAGCATGPGANPDDPLEPMNRLAFKVHEPFDRDIVQPVVTAYRQNAPKPLRVAISNFFNNLSDFVSAINSGLQGKPDKMGDDLGRVLINSGVGLGGLIDVASDLGIEHGNEDFGQTFGVWGAQQGPYLFIPFLGLPTTFRDGTGLIVQAWVGPLGYLPNVPVRNSLYALGVFDARYQNDDALQMANEASLDRYAFIRRAYLQRRLYLLHDGKVPEDKQ